MSKSQWGPPIWDFFHCLVEKIKPEKFNVVSVPIFIFIKKICNNLPCPDCSAHATHYLSRVRSHNLKAKENLKFLLYHFHNTVNKRNGKPDYPFPQMERYSRMSLIDAFNRFTDVYKTRNNMKLLADNFQRQVIVKDLRQWMIANIQSFYP